ncbi:MAG: VanZ family protein [Candidatus Curtissbacteria bacterium]|nr:VanZ family protein [Candidatus Curtissbacteria bacterium]
MQKLLNSFLKTRSPIDRWLPVFIWAAVIFTFSSLPQTSVSGFYLTDFIIKKTAHISEYAILYALTFRASGGKLVGSYLLVMLYAISDEIHQSFVPGRTPKVYDVVGFDLTGANIAAYSLWKLKQIHKKKH